MPILGAAVLPHPPVILPEVGQGSENRLKKTTEAYFEAARWLAGLRPDTVIITSPHSTIYGDYFHISPGVTAEGDMSAFRAPKLRITADYDEDFVTLLSDVAGNREVPAGTLGERNRALDHGTLIPLYFLNKFYSGYRIVRIGLSGQSPIYHYRLGQSITETADRLGRRAAVIASGDLSHKLLEDGPYGYAAEGPEFDRQITDFLRAGDFLSLLRVPEEFADAAAECGLRSFQIMAGALDRKAVSHRLLSYEGPFGVGYAVAVFETYGEDEMRAFGERYEESERARLRACREREDEYVRLARLSLETYIETGKPAVLPKDIPEEMTNTKAGVFVSLKKHGRLRGCIGTISASTENIAEEILKNTVSAAVNDPRFDPVAAGELGDLEYSVYVLGEAEFVSSVDELDEKRYGVIVRSGDRTGLLLPGLEGVNSVEEQIEIARKKAGMRKNEPVELYRFEAVRHN